MQYIVLPLVQSLGIDSQSPFYQLCNTWSNSENETVRYSGENSPFQQLDKDRSINFCKRGIVAEQTL